MKKVYFYYENNKQIFNFKLNQIISQIHDIFKVTKKWTSKAILEPNPSSLNISLAYPFNSNFYIIQLFTQKYVSLIKR